MADNKLVRKTYESTTKANDENRSMVVKISSANPDRSMDVVRPKGAKIDNYLRNPVVALSHDYRGLSIAKTVDIEINDSDIVAKLQFPDKGVYPTADTVYELYKGGFMNAWSIGFIPIKYSDMQGGGKDFEEWELLEYSAVLVPDNPEALTMLRSKGIDTSEYEKLLADKKSVVTKDGEPPVVIPETPVEVPVAVPEVTPEPVVEPTPPVEEAETKEGRVLSTKNRKLLTDVVTSMKTLGDALTELLHATEPAVEDKKSVELADALRLADVVIGKALRNYKRDH